MDEARSATAPVIAVDGPSGSGKSTISRLLARRLSGRYVDTGATYRALTWGLLERGVDIADPTAVERSCSMPAIELSTDPATAQVVLVDGVDVTAEIRGPRITAAVSSVAAVPAARSRLVRLQREWAKACQADDTALVMEGRDIGSVVLPWATVKVWLTADPAIRAARRAAELHGVADEAAAAVVLESIRQRDRLDAGRETSPALPADDAISIDATDRSPEEVVATVLALLPPGVAVSPER